MYLFTLKLSNGTLKAIPYKSIAAGQSDAATNDAIVQSVHKTSR